MNKSNTLTQGPIFKSLFVFSLPMIILNLLQMLFHMTDTAILGVFSSDADVAAVGACGSLVSILTFVVMGYSSAANVVISKRIGAQDKDGARRACGTAIVMGLLSGVLLMVIVLIFSRTFLTITNCQPEILDSADLYMKIYFLGMPITMLYNFIASILRASGDSVSPMVYMIISGILNVILNVLFVVVLKMTVSGVAIATVIANAVSLVLSIIKLSKDKDYCKIERKNIKLFKEETLEIFIIGIPSCIAALGFYLGEVIVVSAVNSLGTNAMAGNAVSSQIDRINYTVGSSVAAAVGIMVSQNFGAGRFDRIRKLVRVGAIYCMITTMLVGLLMLSISGIALDMLADSQAVIELAKERLYFVTLTNFITSTMEIFSNSVRSLKRPRFLLIVGIICGFLIRGCWTWFVWPLRKTITFLFVCLPLSTFVGSLIHYVVYRKAVKREEELAKLY